MPLTPAGTPLTPFFHRAGRRARGPRGPPQRTVDRILQLGQTNVYQGGADIPGDANFLLEKNIVLVVQSGFGFP